MNFLDATKTALKKYFVCAGRASRSEYWYFCLFYMGATGAAAVIDRFLLPDVFVYKTIPLSVLWIVSFLGLIIPSFTVYIRRLHDVGRSGWWMLIGLTIIGLIPLFYWCVIKGDGGTNPYGPPVVSEEPAQKNGTSTALALVTVVFALVPFFLPPPPSLILAAQEGERDAVIQMIEQGADVNEVGLVGMTPLMAAVLMGHADVVELLIQKGADFNAKGAYDMTPLVAATSQNRADIVALLLKHGARIEDKDTGGHPAIDVAVQQGYTEIADMLMKAAEER